MNEDEQDRRLHDLMEMSDEVRSATDFFRFVEEALQAYRDGAYDEREGEKQNLDRYIENVGAIMFSEIKDISEEEDRRQPSWSYVSSLLNRAFVYS